ncbi:MAG: hypothetical protein MN733_23715 [Nitrososphaera sp.]|nr:hypothetical protein [Nitrososphaera sp.]
MGIENKKQKSPWHVESGSDKEQEMDFWKGHLETKKDYLDRFAQILESKMQEEGISIWHDQVYTDGLRATVNIWVTNEQRDRFSQLMVELIPHLAEQLRKQQKGSVEAGLAEGKGESTCVIYIKDENMVSFPNEAVRPQKD